ncbi:RNA polymerase sigma factor SigW [Brevibacillus laterosporus]|uniref:RNA polymerase sigma factor n=1 Tax=Brevibacillus laterosporus LMG 15441 TaxID=1042163 RepID=A0A075R0B0_BRELA|nr:MULTISPECIES: RNA polymerase sigma factor SigW [Brevibacillus]AIG24633.1 RNA polymerase sigma-W factor [Brevibacillus laterosporus LMG 15441]AUM63281.1 RNA polymerase sigma factor SigW [Brevibacillus laterosporus]MBA4533916.1 RNA polymerase sigma factor SigW [Brevibacillus halotolerans]MCR8964950.1 RNA polymerase sigma factor SigW [Brevibacillus laterosporus]MCZ0837105.1 RNA polymerase sigma factor SigW [Brevibacillus halotolerans]
MEFVERRLVERAKRDDREAFAELVEMYKDKIFQLAFRMVGNRQEAEDIAQETFLRVYANLHSYDENYRFSTWIYRIATNLCIDRGRKKKPQFSLDEEQGGDLEGLDWYSRLASDEKTPEEKVVVQELQETVQAALTKLNPKYRSIMVLRYIEDLSLQEISDALQLPITTIKTRIHRGREALRNKLRF